MAFANPEMYLIY